MNKLRIAFVGCGGVAEHYLSVYRELDFAEVRVCVDVDADRAEKAATALAHPAKSAPRVATEYSAALGDDIDLVVINTPNHLHREQTVAAFDAGKHVLLQKPVAATLADAEAIAAAASAAERHGIRSGLYLSYFDQPLMHDLRAMIRAGWFGDIAHLYARLMHRGGLVVSRQMLSGQPNWRASLAQTGGGCFIQLAVHYIHLFKWMMDARVVRVTAMTKNLHCTGVEGEDLACAVLEFSNGALSTLDMAWNTAGEQLSLHGTRGTMEYIGNRTLLLDSSAGEFAGQVIRYSGESSQTSPAAPGASATQQLSIVTASPLGDWQNPFNQHRVFLEALRDGREPFVSIASGADDLRIVTAVYESAKTGRVVILE
ncbi:MAG TPA: Gfo/Idh/MocA family oxidoreductase [Blastocatellia bacterium]|nr:Gfo/Idh/MocA family oxidoreductase [Blastocatellia bacterium]HMV83083.1 Gfo/Idh/MocA family oxidoreductase [Blastocatellia bacterium]HMX30111.1 Gfo/Idh/MocA family oxidoreductase [Blastocatellia bacterium]HMZ18281.1 Gfo/Idh/MocA family oxidoreductase [Blastocatellia bacterium]HNG30980.1 Gfo/Idh/MocA family oxidoreductase [Blastocatellia bacterium]